MLPSVPDAQTPGLVINVRPGLRCRVDADTFCLESDRIALTVDRKTGYLTALRLPDQSENLLAIPCLPVTVRAEGLPDTPPRFLRHEFLPHPEREAAILRLVYEYTGTGEGYELACDLAVFPGVARFTVSASFFRLGGEAREAIRFYDFVFSLTGMSVGDNTRMTVPGPFWPKSYLRPETPIAALAGIERTFHGAPDGGFGVIALQDPTQNLGMIAWMDCGTETHYHPSLSGDGKTLSLTFKNHRHYRLLPGMRVSSDVLRVEFARGTLSDTLKRHKAWATERLPLEALTPDWVKEAVILEVYLKYYPGGFRELTEQLSRYRDLGINVLYLMPHWKGGYSPIDLFEVEPSAGTREDLKALVRRAHDLKMRVLFDMVIHGFNEKSPLPTERHDLFIHSPSGELERHPTWKSISTDWAAPAYREYMVNLVRHDRDEYDIDGYRVDAASYKAASWDPGSPSPAYRSGTAAVEVMDAMLAALRETKPDAVLLSEVFGPVFYTSCNFGHDNQTEAVSWFLEQMDEGKVTAADYKAHLSHVFDLLPDGANRVYYARNHDTSWFYHFNGYTPRFMAIEAIHAFCTIPEIFAGDPKYRHNPDDDPAVYARYRRFFMLRRQYPELISGERLFNEVTCDNPMVFTALRRDGQHTSVVIVSLSEAVETVFIDLHRLGGIGSRVILRDVQDDSTTTVPVTTDGRFTVTLPPCYCRIGRFER